MLYALYMMIAGISLEQASCLSNTIYHEARGESIKGQVLVAKAVINRKNHKEFPNTICKVVYAKNQFEWTWVVKSRKTNFTSNILAVGFILRDVFYKNPEGITFFNQRGFTNRRLQYVMTEGNHKFYKIKVAQ
jgi:hypothetical protein